MKKPALPKEYRDQKRPVQAVKKPAEKNLPREHQDLKRGAVPYFVAAIFSVEGNYSIQNGLPHETCF